jgi:hypothetical protein
MNELIHLHDLAARNVTELLTIFVNWYIFFWTLNAAILSWLYKMDPSPGHERYWRHIGLLMTALFVFLNLLSIAACWFSYDAVARLIEDARSLGARMMSSRPEMGLIPIGTMRFIFVACAISLLCNAIAWAVLPRCRRSFKDTSATASLPA